MFSSVRSLSLPLLFVFFLLAPAFATEADHKYQTEESVTLWVNKVAPYNNPQETYNYYSLPFCHQSENAAHKWGGLGEVLGGNELIDSQIEIKFLKNVDRATICQLELDDQKVKQFKDAIENNYWFEFFMASKYGGISGASHSPRHLSFLKQGPSTLRHLRIHYTSPNSVKLVEHELWQREEKGLIGVLPVEDAAEVAMVDSVLSQG